jgi:hypothetical protein
LSNVASFGGEVDANGHRLVVRNEHGKERRVTVGSGTPPLKAPRVDDRRVDENGQSPKVNMRTILQV